MSEELQTKLINELTINLIHTIKSGQVENLHPKYILNKISLATFKSLSPSIKPDIFEIREIELIVLKKYYTIEISQIDDELEHYKGISKRVEEIMKVMRLLGNI